MTRRVYLTNFERAVYPASISTANETASGGNVIIRCALSEWIYTPDTLTLTVPASGLYSQGGNNSSTTAALAVTNNSGQAYPKVLGNWSNVGWQRVTTSTVPLSVVAYHGSARNNRPVQAVKMFCADTHSNTSPVVTVTAPSLTFESLSGMYTTEYKADIDASGLTTLDQIQCDFKAYGWYGDSSSVLDTTDGVNAQPTPLYSHQYHLLDKSNTYGSTIAVVDSVSGNNATGAVVDAGAFNVGSPPNAYLNIYAAATAIAAYNNTNHSRNDTGAGIIYLRANAGAPYAWIGGATSAGGTATPKTWVTVAGFPGDSIANIDIRTQTGGKQLADKVHLQGVLFNGTARIDTENYVWLDGVYLSSLANPLSTPGIYQDKLVYITGTTIWPCDELRPYSTVASRGLVRNSITASGQSYAQSAVVWTGIGNKLWFNNAQWGIETGTSNPVFDNIIFSHNFFRQTGASADGLALYSTFAPATGATVAGNVFERSATVGARLGFVFGDGAGSPTTPVTLSNFLLWQNVFVGERENLAYNDTNLNNGLPNFMLKWSIVGNMFDTYDIVDDQSSHGAAQNGARVGNHSIVHGTGLSGNAYIQVIANSFNNKFDGIRAVHGSNINPYYVSDKSRNGTGAGFGNYCTKSNSPAGSLIRGGTGVLPYDFNGAVRNGAGYGSAGVCEQAIINTTPFSW